MELLRIYGPEECTEPGTGRGYPFAWDRCPGCTGTGCELCLDQGAIKYMIRALAGHRCVRCRHPYAPGAGEYSPCDEQCRHRGPFSWVEPTEATTPIREHVRLGSSAGRLTADGYLVKAQWRILTVHHLNEVKADCRWWNLVALCQRCHLNIQRRVKLDRPWPYEHSEWFKPYAAGFYASSILGEELTREETAARIEELLALEYRQDRLPGVAA